MTERTGSLPFLTNKSNNRDWVLALIGMLGALHFLASSVLRSMISVMVPSLLFLALAMFGVAFGQWTQQRQVTGTTAVRSSNMAWEDRCICSDPRTVCKINPSNPEIIDVVVRKAYPHYTSVCSLAMTNLGSIPVEFTSQKLIPESIATTAEENKSDGKIRVSFRDDLPSVVTPNEQLVSDLEIIIGDGVLQNTTYQFSLSVDFQQYP